jgi:predicted transposase YdaD
MAKPKFDKTIAHNPHDGLVKLIFTKPEAAAVELRQLLSPALVARLDWDTLDVDPGSYVDPELKHSASDILYSIALKGSEHRISIYVLLDHQSTLELMMVVRFYLYTSRIWARYLSNNKGTKTIPMIVPLLLYQGPNGWTKPQRLSDLFDIPPELAAAFPSPIELCFEVDDLEESVVPEALSRDQLSRDRGLVLAEAARTLLWLFHHRANGFDGERVGRLGLYLDVIAEVWGFDEILALLTYALSAFGPKSPIRDILLKSTSKETSQLIATIRDEYMAEGIKEGRTEGIAEGIAKGIARLLGARELVLTDELRKRLFGCRDDALLTRWFDRAITATTLTEVFDD